MNTRKIIAVLAGGAMMAAALWAASADAKFIKEAGEGGMAEVKLGELAQQKGSSQEVKDFGALMVKDHSKANDELKEIASKGGVTLSSDLNAKDKSLYDKLDKLSGADFDRAYMNAMVKDHETDIAAFSKEADGGKDQAVKDFASKTLPTLREHLTHAKSAAAAVGSKTD
jgi:putative membrane protein